MNRTFLISQAESEAPELDSICYVWVDYVKRYKLPFESTCINTKRLHMFLVLNAHKLVGICQTDGICL